MAESFRMNFINVVADFAVFLMWISYSESRLSPVNYTRIPRQRSDILLLLFQVADLKSPAKKIRRVGHCVNYALDFSFKLMGQGIKLVLDADSAWHPRSIPHQKLSYEHTLTERLMKEGSHVADPHLRSLYALIGDMDRFVFMRQPFKIHMFCVIGHMDTYFVEVVTYVNVLSC